MQPRSLALLTSSFASFGCSGHVTHADPKLFPNIQFCSPKSWKHHKGSQRIQENPAESQRVSVNPRVSSTQQTFMLAVFNKSLHGSWKKILLNCFVRRKFLHKPGSGLPACPLQTAMSAKMPSEGSANKQCNC